MKPILIYRSLLRKFGKQGWWPAQSKFEIVVGAILTQNTNWRNVEKAIANLRKAKMLDPKKISHVEKRKIEKLIRPSGFYRQKAGRLKGITEWFISVNPKKGKKKLREELLSIKGVGKETADSVLLYAFNKPVFVIDAYTRRMCNRHKLVEGKDYEDYCSFFEKNLPKDVKLYKEFHALIVELGKRYCRKKPECEECPVFGLA